MTAIESCGIGRDTRVNREHGDTIQGTARRTTMSNSYPSSWQSKTGYIELGAPDKAFNGMKIFSATMAMDRERLGDKLTAWMDHHPECEVREAIVTQSSDEAFHCITITVFYWETQD
jgi:hypothetical protein